MSASLAYRVGCGPDLTFVVSSWLSSFRGAHAAGLIAVEDWHDIMEPQVLKVLARPGVTVHVAYRPGESSESGSDLYGWIASETGHAQPLVHYVYVKRGYRAPLGIARGLFRAAGIDPKAPFYFTCQTAASRSIQQARKIPQARWMPLIARHPKTKPPRGNDAQSSKNSPVH